MAHIRFQHTFLVAGITRLKNSVNGNPRFKIVFSNGLVGETKRDAGFAYAIHSGMTIVTVKYHFTPKGRCIIDDILEGSFNG